MRKIQFGFYILACLLGGSSCTKTPNPPEVVPVSQDSVGAVGGVEEEYLHTDRVVWQKPELVIDLLGDLRGKTVADIGAGTGFFALRLAPLAEKVIAIDIEPKFLEHLDSIRQAELPAAIRERLEVRLSEPQNPRIKAEEADVVLIVNTYMYIQNRVAYLQKLRTGMRPKGRILLIDFKKKITSLGPPKEIRIPQFQVEEELEQAGYQIIESNDTALDYQYIILAEKTN